MSGNRTSSHRSSSRQDGHPSGQAPDGQDYDQEPSAEPRPISRQASYEMDRIGDILRRVREHRGEDLEEISDYLRIRPGYLVALENSRYDDLPADAYVIGFLRTYALYLGLDGKGAIDQYRREMAGRRRKPQLNMPQPMVEGRAPTASVLVGAAIAVLLVYGIWYGLSSPDPETREKAMPLAVTSQEIPVAVPASAAANPTTPTEATTLPAQTATSEGIELSVPASAVPATTVAATPSPADAKTEQKPAESAAVEALKAEAPAQPAAPSTAKEPVKEDGAASKAEKDKNKKEAEANKDDAKNKGTKDAAKEAKDKIEAVPLDADPAKTDAPKVYGEKGKSRLSIKAEKESWVMVTDSKGNTVFDKTLKPGETYNVPSGKGLKLTTGNASGVAFSLDGAPMPKLGSSEAIVRAVPLDPEKLKSRLDDGETSND